MIERTNNWAYSKVLQKRRFCKTKGRIKRKDMVCPDGFRFLSQLYSKTASRCLLLICNSNPNLDADDVEIPNVAQDEMDLKSISCFYSALCSQRNFGICKGVAESNIGRD